MDNIVNELIEQMVSKISKKYKMSHDDIRKHITDELNKNRDFLEVAKKQKNVKSILRLSNYKKIFTKIKANIYNDLRKYYQQPDNNNVLNNQLTNTENQQSVLNQLLASHVSTKERLSEINGYYNEIINSISSINTVIDIGCGLNPLMFPLNYNDNHIQKYIALDKDKTTIKLLKKYCESYDINCITPIHWNISDDFNTVYEKTNIIEYDLALVMKVIPVVQRLDKNLVNILENTPAKFLLITGNKFSMTKKISIEKRERKIIEQFISNTNLIKITEFNKQNEFGFLVKRNI